MHLESIFVLLLLHPGRRLERITTLRVKRLLDMLLLVQQLFDISGVVNQDVHKKALELTLVHLLQIGQMKQLLKLSIAWLATEALSLLLGKHLRILRLLHLHDMVLHLHVLHDVGLGILGVVIGVDGGRG